MKVLGNARGDAAVLVSAGPTADTGGLQVWLRAADKSSFRRVLRVPTGTGSLRADVALGPRGDLQVAYQVISADGKRQLRSVYRTAKGKLTPTQSHGTIGPGGGQWVAVDQTGARTLLWAADLDKATVRFTIEGANSGRTFKKRSTVTGLFASLVTSPSGSAILEVLRGNSRTIADVRGGRVGKSTGPLPSNAEIALGRGGAALAVFRKETVTLMIERPGAGKPFSAPHTLGLSKSTSYCHAAANLTGRTATVFCSSGRWSGNTDDLRRPLYVTTRPLGG